MSDSPDRRRPRHSRHAIVVSYLALLVALSGTAWAAATIGPNDIKKNAVRSKHIKKSNVKKRDLHADSVGSGKVIDNSITGTDVSDESLGNADLGTDSVGSSEIAAGAVGSNELGSNSVVASKFPLTVRDTTVSVPDGTTALLESPCNAGEEVVGGGATWSAGFNDAQAAGTHLVHSRPNPDLSGWAARGYNDSGAARTLFVRAVCLGSG